MTRGNFTPQDVLTEKIKIDDNDDDIDDNGDGEDGDDDEDKKRSRHLHRMVSVLNKTRKLLRLTTSTPKAKTPKFYSIGVVRGEAAPEVRVETPARGRGRARGRERGRGRARGAAPARGRGREPSPEPQIGVAAEQAPAGHAPPVHDDRLNRIFGLLERLAQGATGIPAGLQAGVGAQAPGYQHQIPVVTEPVVQPPQVPAPVVGVTAALEVALADDDQVCYERFQKMKPPQFHGAKTDDAHEFLTLSREMSAAVRMLDERGVRFVSLQLRGVAREWLRTFMSSRPAGSPLMEWSEFASAFEGRFIPWSVQEESHMRFESLVQGSMSVADYEARFCQLSRHASALISGEPERIHRFVRGLTPTIRSYVFRSSREGASFQTIVSAAREAELLERDDFGGPKRVRTGGQYSGTSSEGRGPHRGGGSFLRQRPVHASLPAIEGGPAARGPPGSGR
ncbi:hypothetical protein MTR67_049863, partial [Solanum verrucosum]